MDIKENPVELIQDINPLPEVFLYVNVLTGKHAKTRDTEKLAVFKNDAIGRQWEQQSHLSQMLRELIHSCFLQVIVHMLQETHQLFGQRLLIIFYYH